MVDASCRLAKCPNRACSERKLLICTVARPIDGEHQVVLTERFAAIPLLAFAAAPPVKSLVAAGVRFEHQAVVVSHSFGAERESDLIQPSGPGQRFLSVAEKDGVEATRVRFSLNQYSSIKWLCFEIEIGGAEVNGGWFSVEGCEIATNTQLVRDARALLLKEPLVLKRPSGYVKRIGASPSAQSD